MPVNRIIKKTSFVVKPLSCGDKGANNNLKKVIKQKSKKNNIMKNQELTTEQNNLIESLKAEFLKTNNINTDKKRFSIDTALQCNDEKKRFLNELQSQNLIVANSLKQLFDEQVKQLSDEFNEYFNIEIGKNVTNGESWNNFDSMIKRNLEINSCTNTIKGGETIIRIISKTKKDANGFMQTTLYCDFKRENVSKTIENGETIKAFKIVGLNFKIFNWLNDQNCTMYNSLDELLQENKWFQQIICNILN